MNGGRQILLYQEGGVDTCGEMRWYRHGPGRAAAVARVVDLSKIVLNLRYLITFRSGRSPTTLTGADVQSF